MVLEAEICCEYENEEISEAIASSLEPDNLDSPENVKVKTGKDGEFVRSKIEVDGEIETLLATMDDLLSCTSTAERMV